MLYVDIKLWLPNLLCVEDKESMAHSLEDRVPLLDNTVIDLALRIPAHVKIKELQLKFFLKKSVSDRLPQSVLNHKKKGFPQPWSEWIRESKHFEQLQLLLMNGELIERQIIKKRYIQKMLHQHYFKLDDRSWEVWQLICTEIWFRIFFPKKQSKTNSIG